MLLSLLLLLPIILLRAIDLLVETATIVLKRLDDMNTLPFVYIILAFLLSLIKVSELVNSRYIDSILKAIPWELLYRYINTMFESK